MWTTSDLSVSCFTRPNRRASQTLSIGTIRHQRWPHFSPSVPVKWNELFGGVGSSFIIWHTKRLLSVLNNRLPETSGPSDRSPTHTHTHTIGQVIYTILSSISNFRWIERTRVPTHQHDVPLPASGGNSSSSRERGKKKRRRNAAAVDAAALPRGRWMVLFLA